jgi:hypothetical protein
MVVNSFDTMLKYVSGKTCMTTHRKPARFIKKYKKKPSENLF